MINNDSLALRLLRKDALRNIVNIVCVWVATVLFFVALLYGRDESWHNVLYIAFSKEGDFKAILLCVFFAIFLALALTLSILQFKNPNSVTFISAIQLPVLIIAFVMTAGLCEYKKTAALLYSISLGLTVIVFVFGVLYLLSNEEKPSIKREGRLRSFLIMLFSLLMELTVFFVPLLSFTKGEEIRYEILFYVFSAEKSTLLSSILFVIYFIAFIATFLVAINHFKYLYQDNDDFNSKLNRIVYLSVGVTLSYFLVGTVISFYYKTGSIHPDASTVAYIPFLLSSGLLLLDAIFNGRFKEKKERAHRTGLFMRVLMLLFIIIFTGLTVVSLFSNLIIAKFENLNFGTLRINGLDVLMHYKEYGESYQTVAFLLMSMVIVSGLLFLVSLIAFLRNSKLFKSMFLITISVDFFSIAALAAFGKYYEVVQKANIERLQSLFAFLSIPIEAKCTVTSDVLYYFLAAVGILVMIFILRPYTRYVIEENALEEIAISGDSVIGVESLGGAQPNEASVVAESEGAEFAASNPQEKSAPVADATREEIAEAPASSLGEVNAELPAPKPALPVIDQCPPFTFLDEQVPVYAEKLEEREKLIFAGATLKSIMEFIVNYAKNSRLHLSYTPQDIATFIAGLGIGRLSILQGMSGTGKTSLPKIFSEAIFGNCEIVEVESSWKDKNELLGYYNEFSKIYTPKKFTQDLYKAKLNPSVITFIVLDEMNLSRIEYYFSDFLSLMENEEDKREIKLVNIRIANYESGERVSYTQLTDDMVLKIPNNVWFIGTANRDESTFEISDKVYDRASTMNFNKRAKKITEFDAPMSRRFLRASAFLDLVHKALDTVSFNLADMPQIAKAEELLAPYNLSFGNRIERQIEGFVKIYSACFEGEDVINEALETIFLSKVIAKLEFKTVENKDELAEGFDEIGLKRCADFIRKLNEDV